MISDRENWLRTVEFRYPEWIPCTVSFSPLTWHTYRVQLEEILLRYPHQKQVRETVERMGAPEGGLLISGSIWDAHTPLENIDALCGALEDYCLKGR